MAVVFDWSGCRFDPTALLAAGVTGASRYLAPVGTGDWKRIGKAEYDALLAGGIAVVLNWEDTATRWRAGFNAGVVDGRIARAQARQLGHPDSRPIIVSVDSGDQLQRIGDAVEYVRGFSEGGGQGPQAVYAGTNVIEAAVRAGAAQWGWKAAATSWSTVPGPSVRMVQHFTKPFTQFVDACYDWNETLHADWGQHPFTRRGFVLED